MVVRGIERAREGEGREEIEKGIFFSQDKSRQVKLETYKG